MKRAFLLSTTRCMLLLGSSFLGNFAQSNFVPVEWTPEVTPSKQCGLTITSDLSDALTTVSQLVKSTDSSSSFPKSCMEIKESSSLSPSGYYTISNGTGGFAVVYCNMDELCSCLALEQTLNGYSYTLTEVSNTLATNDACNKISTSCQEVWDKCPECTSGYYKILTAELTEKYVHCNFEEKCGTAGPWTRVAFLNMSESSKCPDTLRLYEANGVRACGRQVSSTGSCNSVDIPSLGFKYTQICGRVVGYQFARTDAFHVPSAFVDDIDVPYIEGISITFGSPRQHIWTYAASRYENNPGANEHNCPCTEGSLQKTPSLVGNDYYCEAGCHGTLSECEVPNILYTDDQLWDGENCGEVEEMCCNSNTTQPWFHKILNYGVTDDIELRVCSNADTTSEDVPVEIYEIYIK